MVTEWELISSYPSFCFYRHQNPIPKGTPSYAAYLRDYVTNPLWKIDCITCPGCDKSTGDLQIFQGRSIKKTDRLLFLFLWQLTPINGFSFHLLLSQSCMTAMHACVSIMENACFDLWRRCSGLLALRVYIWNPSSHSAVVGSLLRHVLRWEVT